jgi:hypothetical protein
MVNVVVSDIPTNVHENPFLFRMLRNDRDKRTTSGRSPVAQKKSFHVAVGGTFSLQVRIANRFYSAVSYDHSKLIPLLLRA